MTREELIPALSETLSQKVGRIATRYICFNVNTTEIVIRYNLDVVKTEVKVYSYVGLAQNWAVDCWAIATEIDKMCRDKFGIEILEQSLY